MSARLLGGSIARQRAFRHALGATVGVSFSSAALLRSQPKVRFDSRTTPRRAVEDELPVTKQTHGGLDPDILRQLSGGSISGSSAPSPGAFSLCTLL